MIVGAAVCPGAPFLVDGTADSIAGRQRPVVLACADVVGRLPPAELTLLITGSATAVSLTADPDAAGWRMLAPGSPIPTTPVRRSDRREHGGLRLAGGLTAGQRDPVRDPAVGTIVGAHLLEKYRQTGQRSSTSAVEVGADPDGAARAVADMLGGAQRVAVLVIADGSACHGDSAPGRRDDRSDSFDLALAGALSAGDPAALQRAAADRVLARELLATVDPLAILSRLTADRPPTEAELLYSAAPMGVGYLVASWRWTDS